MGGREATMVPAGRGAVLWEWMGDRSCDASCSDFGWIIAISLLARALSATLEQQLTTEPAEQVYNSIFRSTIFHLMTLGLKKNVINWSQIKHFL